MTLRPRPVHVPASGASGPRGFAICGNGCRVSSWMAGNGRKAKSGDSSMESPHQVRPTRETLVTLVPKPAFGRVRALSRTGRTLGTVSLPVVLIPGAAGQAWVWHLVEADLRRRGYDAFAVDLPAADESKGLPAYADAVVSAVRDRAVRDRAVRDRAVGDRTAGGRAPVTIAAYSLGA